MDESGDEEEQEAVVNQVLDEIGIEISGKVKRRHSKEKNAVKFIFLKLRSQMGILSYFGHVIYKHLIFVSLLFRWQRLLLHMGVNYQWDNEQQLPKGQQMPTLKRCLLILRLK